MRIDHDGWSGWLHIAGLIVGVGPLLAGCQPDDRAPEALGEVQQPVWDGDDSTVDTANAYNAVGQFFVSGAGGCSAVLVTPFWVMTAAHCFDGGIAAGNNFDVVFNWDSFHPEDGQTFHHTGAAGGGSDVVMRITEPFQGDLNQAAQDIAIFRLDDRVPDDVAMPIHLPTTVDACPSGFGSATGFTATTIGYADTLSPPCGDLENRFWRRYSTHDQWFRLGQIDGAIYNKTFVNSLAFCSEYSGQAPGDSGGAFIDESGNLCGIVSGYLGPAPDPFFPWVLYTSNHMAAVDSEETLDWLDSVEANGKTIQDIHGNWDGECPAYLDTCDDGDCDDDDADDDGSVDVCDVCPYVANESEFDADSDGVADCLDVCPNDPIQPGAPACDHYGDFDCDGTCDSSDDCPYAANPTHANANTDAEAAWGAGEMGDACEPVPVPAGDPSDYVVLDSVTLNSPFLESVTKLIQQDEVSIQTQKSRRAANLSSGTASANVSKVTTRFRFCQNDPTMVACDDASLVNTSQLHLEVANATAERPSFRYHRITMSFSTTRGANATLTYNDAWHEWQWKYAADAAFWQSSGLVNVPPPENGVVLQGGPASGLDGRFWVHASTTVGVPGNDVGTGTHGPTTLTHTEQLASRYFWLDPEFITWSNISRPLMAAAPFFLWQTLSDPGPEYLQHANAGVLPGDAQLIVPVEGDDFGILGLDGNAQLLGDHLGAGLRASLHDDSLVWASSAEPTAYVGSSRLPMAIALKENGKAILEHVTVDSEGTLRGDADVRAAPSGPIGTSARHGFTPIYSRALESVFVIGGRDEAGHRAASILRAGLTDPSFTALVPSVRLRDVFAATYSYRDDSLYLLDSRHASCDSAGDVDACEDGLAGAPGAVVRFVRVDPHRGDAAELAAWAASDLPEVMWLGSDALGRVLISLSSDSAAAHAIVRYDSDAGTIARLLRGEAPLAFPAAIDPNGMVIYTEGPDGMVGERFGELSGSSRALSQLPEML